MKDMTLRPQMSVEEMSEYYAANHPYLPTRQRVGRYAKTIGFRLVKQMVHRKYIYFYARTDMHTSPDGPVTTIKKQKK
jgi:hypothetical protein